MNHSDPKEFGQQIALLRKAQGLSQSQLAKVSGVPLTAIRRCEQKGQIPLDRYLTLTTALKAVIEIHGASATQQPVMPTGDSRPNLLPFKSIEEVIANGAVSMKSRETRKPNLGGMFSKPTWSSPV